jgi:glutamate--cysteine ligase
MMFVVRNGKWIAARHLTFKKFIEKGFQGIHPTQTDFELHLSTIFTDVRFKQYMEIRGMDGQRSHLIPAVFAFWKGILYDDEARQNVTKLLKGFSEKELHRLHRDVEKYGLQAKIKRISVLDLARQLVRISEKGLVRRDLANGEGQDESIFLAPLKEEILKTGKTPAEQAARLWTGIFKRDREALIDYLKI